MYKQLDLRRKIQEKVSLPSQEKLSSNFQGSIILQKTEEVAITNQFRLLFVILQRFC